MQVKVAVLGNKTNWYHFNLWHSENIETKLHKNELWNRKLNPLKANQDISHAQHEVQSGAGLAWLKPCLLKSYFFPGGVASAV